MIEPCQVQEPTYEDIHAVCFRQGTTYHDNLIEPAMCYYCNMLRVVMLSDQACQCIPAPSGDLVTQGRHQGTRKQNIYIQVQNERDGHERKEA